MCVCESARRGKRRTDKQSGVALWQATVTQAWQGKRTVAVANGTSLHCVSSKLTGAGEGKKGKEEACLLRAKAQSFSPCRRSRLSIAFHLPCKRLSCTSKFFEKPRSDFSSTSVPYRLKPSGRLLWSNIMTPRFRYNLWCPAIYFEPQTAANDGSRQNSQPSSLCFYNDQEAIC